MFYLSCQKRLQHMGSVAERRLNKNLTKNNQYISILVNFLSQFILFSRPWARKSLAGRYAPFCIGTEMAFFKLWHIAKPKFSNSTFNFPLYLVLFLSLENIPSNGILIFDRHLSRSRFLFLLLFFLIVALAQPLAKRIRFDFFVSYSLSINTI